MNADGLQRAGGSRSSVESSTARPPAVKNNARKIPWDEPEAPEQAALAADPPAPPPQDSPSPPAELSGLWALAGWGGSGLWCDPPAWEPAASAVAAAVTAAGSVGAPGGGG